MIGERINDTGLTIDAAAAAALASGGIEDPFALLGPHGGARGVVIRAFVPPAQGVEVIGPDGRTICSTVHPLPGDNGGVKRGPGAHPQAETPGRRQRRRPIK